MQKHSGDEEIIKELCVTNGICYEKLPPNGSPVSSLEMLFSGYPRMVGLSLFPGLTQLTVIGQAVTLIQGLEACSLLRELWVVECQLTDISGLQTCTKLQKLYLYDNKITKVENLEQLENLHVLWLNSNFITTIEGLDSLQDLRELNLADNRIEKVGHGLSLNVNLQDLNMSGNKIGSFKELTHLANLPELKVLTLKDPQCGPNPVCLLCNYTTHVLFHMPHLQHLDTYDVSSRQLKDAAESTVKKKVMYYNMRVKCVQKQLADRRAQLIEHKRQLHQLLEERVRHLSRTLKHLEDELAQVQARKPDQLQDDSPAPTPEDSDSRSDTPGDHSLELKLLLKLEALKRRVRLWVSRLEEVETCHQRELALLSERRELMESFLVMELETVGNVRFEEGSPADPWFTSCSNLLLSRFCAKEYQTHGITGVRVTHVIRMHNRALRLRFDDKLQSLLEREEHNSFSQNHRKWLEYLFHVPDQEAVGDKRELLCVMEEGFRPTHHEAVGIKGAVLLSNSLSVSERPRLEQFQPKAKAWARPKEGPLALRHGCIIVTKAFLGRLSLPVRDGEPLALDRYPWIYSVYRSITTGTCAEQTGTERRYSLTSHSGCQCGVRPTQWFVFDYELVLPEYLIEFEYMTQDRSWTSVPELRESEEGKDPAVFQHDTKMDEEILGMEPVLHPQPKMLSLDEKAILAMAHANVLSQITVLNLQHNSLNKLKGISQLAALRHLTVSFNELTHLDGVSHMHSLEVVEASHNHIVTLEGVRGLVRLKHLDLSWNQLSRARKETSVLCKHAPCLLRLDVRYNPWQKPGEVRTMMIGRLRTLTHLDDELVTKEEATISLQATAASQINKASILAHSRTNTERPRCLSLLSVAQLLTQFSPNPRDHSAEPEPGWTSKITVLNLDSRGLSRLTNLEQLVNLRWASFSDNNISRVEGLEACLHLEELSLDDNCISRLDGMPRLHRLTRLSVNGNRLTCLEGRVLAQLPNLHFLSAENNHVMSLSGLEQARSLFELYIGNNLITEAHDICCLKALANLVILDLYGNPIVTKQESYRLYIVFHLPSLKALDGQAVEAPESEHAKDMFGGRLTSDMVAEKLGHSQYSQITELNLQSSYIRMVDLAPVDLFHSLCCINLEHNNLTSFSGLVYLPNVKVLWLNYNRIESILPRQKSTSQLSGRQTLYHKVSSSGYGQQQPVSRANRDQNHGECLEPLMTSLEVLHLGFNGISSLSSMQLDRLTGLRALFLQGNEISQVEGLEGLTQLRELVLDRNRIRVLAEASLRGQAALLELHLAENRLRELSHLQPLVQLRRLFLGTNKVQELSEVEKLEELPSLVELSVQGNPVARRSQYRPTVVLRLSQLQVLDGLAVSAEERARAELLLGDAQQCGVPCALALDTGMSGLLPSVTRAAPPCGDALLHLLRPEILLPCHVEETLCHNTAKYRKQRHSGGVQSEVPVRQPRGSMPAGTLLTSGHRVFIPYSGAPEQNGRFQSHSAPRPPM